MITLSISQASFAGTYANWSGDTYLQSDHDKQFKVTGDNNKTLSLTVSCVNNKAGGGSYRAYFYTRSPQGGWRQISELRIMIQSDMPETTKTFNLPPGEYKVELRVRRMKYSFLLTDG